MRLEARWKNGFGDWRFYYVGDFRVAELSKTKRGYSTVDETVSRDSKRYADLDVAIMRVHEATNDFVKRLHPDLEVDHDPKDPEFQDG